MSKSSPADNIYAKREDDMDHLLRQHELTTTGVSLMWRTRTSNRDEEIFQNLQPSRQGWRHSTDIPAQLFSYQTIETMVPKELEFPQESQAGRRKRQKPGSSQRRKLVSREEISHSSEILSEPPCRRHELDPDRFMKEVGDTTPWQKTTSLNILLVLYLNLKLIPRSWRWETGIRRATECFCCCSFSHYSHTESLC